MHEFDLDLQEQPAAHPQAAEALATTGGRFCSCSSRLTLTQD
ncbi:hypothetical protein [Crossiella sp. NPDC003009]